jgi:hypothetical protein
LFNSVQTYCFVVKYSHLLSSNGASTDFAEIV